MFLSSEASAAFDDLQPSISFRFSLQATPPSPDQRVLDVVPVQPAASSLRACVPAFSPSSTSSSNMNISSSVTFQCSSPSLLKFINQSPSHCAPVIIKETNILVSFKSLLDNISSKTNLPFENLC